MPKPPETPYQALLSRHRWLERQFITVCLAEELDRHEVHQAIAAAQALPGVV